jgi:hypothetical protein
VVAQAEVALASARLGEALERIHYGFSRLRGSTLIAELPCGWPEGDRLLRGLGLRARALMGITPSGRPAPGRRLYVASELYDRGGHTALVGDLVRAAPPGSEHRVLVTHVTRAGRGVTPEVLGRLGLEAASVREFQGARSSELLRWLLEQTEGFRPEVVALLHHPLDLLAVAAALPAPGRLVAVFHHNDGAPSAGLHLPEARIIDVTPFRHRFSRQVLGIEAEYLPLTVPRPTVAENGPPPGEPLTCASASGVGKFRLDYRYPYPEVVALRLRDLPGQHVHIGPMRRDLREALTRALAGQGVERRRIVHVARVPSLATALNERGVHLYLSSFPVGGARASVEALAAGVPQIWHSPAPERDPELLHLCYPSAAVWRTPPDLVGILRSATPEWQGRQGTAARQHYERFHSPEHFRETLGRILAGLPTEIPPLPLGPDPMSGLRDRYEAYRRGEGLA